MNLDSMSNEELLKIISQQDREMSVISEINKRFRNHFRLESLLKIILPNKPPAPKMKIFFLLNIYIIL